MSQLGGIEFKLKSVTLRCQINEYTRLFQMKEQGCYFEQISKAKINKQGGKFANQAGWKRCEFIWAYLFMKFAKNNHPTRLYGPTRLFGT